MNKTYKIIYAISAFILGLYFFFLGVIEAQGFLAPIVIAAVLSLIIFPLSRRLELVGLSRSLACLVSTFIVFLATSGIILLMIFQFQNFIQKWPTIKETMAPKIIKIENYISENTPVSKSKIRDVLENNNPITAKKSITPSGEEAISFFTNTAGIAGTYFLIIIYIFFILRYRRRFKIFFYKILPKSKQQEIKNTFSEIVRVVSNFLVGKLSLMGILLVCYVVGLGLSGVEDFILVSLIAVILTLIPYLGNMIGFATALAYGYLTSGDFYVLIGVMATFSISQFIESYVLQPYIIGKKVNLHPFFVILMVILGGSLWGIAGMILAIPITAILTVLLSHIPKLKDFALLLRKTDLEEDKK